MIPDLCSIRSDIGSLMVPGPDRHYEMVIALALDGVGIRNAAECLRHATVLPRKAVFPTTSATGWLSSMLGAPVDTHGVPGVVFAVDGALKNVYSTTTPLCPPSSTVFHDALRVGYRPVALCGDLTAFVGGSWMSALLDGAQIVSGPKLVTGAGLTAASVQSLEEGVQAARAQRHAPPPFVWVHIDIDQHIHRHGCDDAVRWFLREIDRLACEWVDQAGLVVAWSDHGLVRTDNHLGLQAMLARLGEDWGVTFGGAGRTRWVYSRPEVHEAVTQTLVRELPDGIRVADRADFFDAQGNAYERVGQTLLIAEGRSFLADSGVSYEHGSLLPDEVDVYLAVWGRR